MGESTLQRAVKIAKQQAQEAALRAMWEVICFPNTCDYYIRGKCDTADSMSDCLVVAKIREKLDGGTPKGNVGDNPQTEVEK